MRIVEKQNTQESLLSLLAQTLPVQLGQGAGGYYSAWTAHKDAPPWQMPVPAQSRFALCDNRRCEQLDGLWDSDASCAWEDAFWDLDFDTQRICALLEVVSVLQMGRTTDQTQIQRAASRRLVNVVRSLSRPKKRFLWGAWQGYTFLAQSSLHAALSKLNLISADMTADHAEFNASVDIRGGDFPRLREDVERSLWRDDDSFAAWREGWLAWVKTPEHQYVHVEQRYFEFEFAVLALADAFEQGTIVKNTEAQEPVMWPLALMKPRLPRTKLKVRDLKLSSSLMPSLKPSHSSRTSGLGGLLVAMAINHRLHRQPVGQDNWIKNQLNAFKLIKRDAPPLRTAGSFITTQEHAKRVAHLVDSRRTTGSGIRFSMTHTDTDLPLAAELALVSEDGLPLPMIRVNSIRGQGAPRFCNWLAGRACLALQNHAVPCVIAVMSAQGLRVGPLIWAHCVDWSPEKSIQPGIADDLASFDVWPRWPSTSPWLAMSDDDCRRVNVKARMIDVQDAERGAMRYTMWVELSGLSHDLLEAHSRSQSA